MEPYRKYFSAIFIFSAVAVTIANADTSDSSILLPEVSNYATFFQEKYAKAVDGDANAQLYIGVLYEHGLGIGKDLLLSHAYYNLAAASGTKEAISRRKNIEKLLSKDEFANARKLASFFKPGVGIDHPRQIASIELLSNNIQNESESKENKFDENIDLESKDNQTTSDLANAAEDDQIVTPRPTKIPTPDKLDETLL